MLLATLLSLALPLAHAQEAADASVLVSQFQPRNREAEPLAALIESFLIQELRKQQGLDVHRVEELPAFQDYSSRVYLQSCPSGEIVGCTYVAAERGEVDWAITGTVRTVVDGTTVTVDILDIRGQKVVVSFTSELQSGTDEAFAEGVAKVLVAAISGSVGGEKDKRNLTPDQEEGLSNEAIAAQLEELSREVGDISAVVTRGDRDIKRPEFTVNDLEKQMSQEGAKPWERLGMTPQAYLHYKNSGMSLMEWRARSMGRQGQLLLRPHLGLYHGPTQTIYNGYYATEGVQTVDRLAVQGVEVASVGSGGVGVAYGIHPWVEVGVDVGISKSAFIATIDNQVVGQANTAGDVSSFSAYPWYLSPQVLVAPLPTANFRPVGGVGVTYLHGASYGDFMAPVQNLAVFGDPSMVFIQGTVGGEAQLSDTIDFFLHVPLQVLVYGGDTQEERTGSQQVLVDIERPGGPGALSTGVQLGLQIRIGGKPPEKVKYLEDEEPPM